MLSAKFDIVSGYVSGQDIDLAVERGELQCRAFTITAYYAQSRLYLGANEISQTY